MSKQFTVQEVAAHNKESDAWVIIDGEVFNVTDFAAMHPGGELLLLQYAGKDVTEEFYGLHRQEVLDKFRAKLKVGDIAGAVRKVVQSGGALSKVPYAEPSFFQGFKSTYFTDSHLRFRSALRKFYHEEILEEARTLETLEKVPPLSMYQKLGSAGILAARLGPGAHMKGFPQLGGIDPASFDYFHELIAHEEHGRLGLPGIADGMGAGHVIGLPPIMNFGPAWMKEKVLPEVLRGDKRICLAITEPTAGSDVAGLSTTAKKTADGKFFIVNGVKKWITNGVFADYFTTAVRTEKGISVLLIPRTEGVTTKPIKTSYSPAAGTSLVILENVKVPVENLIGTEGHGFQVIMFNFNHERWAIVASVVSGARLVVEESLKWAHQRKVFGKRLIDQPVIRFKLANMIAQVESVESWLENITYQMTKMSYKEQSMRLAGPIALLKLQSTRVAGYVSDESCQILGGRAITKTGMGSVVEAFQRSYKFGAILGGSEEIMADLGVRQLMKDFPNAKL